MSEKAQSETRNPKVGEPVACRLAVTGVVKAGVVDALKPVTGVSTDKDVLEELEDDPMAVLVRVHGAATNGGDLVKNMLYSKGAKFVQTWCWPEEVE